MRLSITIAGVTIVKALESLPNVTQWEKKAFSSVGLSIGEKIFAMRVRGQLVIKLRSARVDELIERGVGERFALGQKRMKEWIAFSPPRKRTVCLFREKPWSMLLLKAEVCRSLGLDNHARDVAWLAHAPLHKPSSPRAKQC